MVRKRNKRNKKVPKEDAGEQATALIAPQPGAAKKSSNEVSIKGLHRILHDIAARAEENQHNLEVRYTYVSQKLGYANDDLRQIELELQTKEDNDAATAEDQNLLNVIYEMRHEQGICTSLKEFEAAISELERPPCSISKKDFTKCIKDLHHLQELIEGHYKYRQHLDEFFDDEPDLYLFKHFFYDYSGTAIEKARVHLQDAFDAKIKVKSPVNKESWKATEQLWRNNILNDESLAQTGLNDRISYKYRHNVYVFMNQARDLIDEAEVFRSCRKDLEELYTKIRLNVKDFKEHTKHLRIMEGSAASLAHIPVSRRSLIRY